MSMNYYVLRGIGVLIAGLAILWIVLTDFKAKESVTVEAKYFEKDLVFGLRFYLLLSDGEKIRVSRATYRSYEINAEFEGAPQFKN